MPQLRGTTPQKEEVMGKKLFPVIASMALLVSVLATIASAGGTNCPVSGSTQGPSHDPVVGQGWQVGDKDTYRTVEFWTNESGYPQNARKVFLRAGQNPPLRGGGTFWYWPKSCQSQALTDYRNNELPGVSIIHLAREGLIQADLAPTG